MNRPILQAKDIRAGYSTEDILHNISFDLHPGEVLGVIGPNGCGKSTLLRTLTGLLPLRSGSITYENSNLSTLSPAKQARLCAVQLQTESPSFDFPIDKFVLLGRHPHRSALSIPTLADHSAVASALTHTELSHLASRSIRSISSGEWQRTLLARALAQDTPILLLDEPAAHLDPGHRYAMHTLLRSLSHDKNLAVLCISHDLNLAAEFCDRLMILKEGSIRALGKPNDILTDTLLQNIFQCPALRITPNPFTGQPNTVFTS